MHFASRPVGFTAGWRTHRRQVDANHSRRDRRGDRHRRTDARRRNQRHNSVSCKQNSFRPGQLSQEGWLFRLQDLIKRILIATIGVLACAFGIWQAARVGSARTLARYALVTNDREAAARAVRISPGDAETHATRGVVLQHTENYAEAIRELERAIQLRPRDYYTWMMLGVTRDLSGDPNGALEALRQSVVLAPNYARTHWQLGNLLLRLGQTDESFKELRFAAASDPTFLPNVIDLAWGISRDDPARTVEIMQPQTDDDRFALAIFFAQRHQENAALDQFRSLKSLANDRVQDLVHELLNAELFAGAYDVWARLHNIQATPAQLLNGSFEDDVVVGQKGFGWQIPAEPANLTISIDPSQ